MPLTLALYFSVGITTLAVFMSLSHPWFSTRWSGSYEFYSGGEDAFGARGYPVQIAIRLIVVVSIATIALLVGSASLKLFGTELRRLTVRTLHHFLLALSSCNLLLVLSALLMPPRGMVRFPPLQLARGAYVGLGCASAAVLISACAALRGESKLAS